MSATNDDTATLNNEKPQTVAVGETARKNEHKESRHDYGQDAEKNLEGAAKAQEKLPEVLPASREDGGLWGWLAVLGRYVAYILVI